MKIEQIILSNQEVYFVTPPTLYDLPLFDCLFQLFCHYVNHWIEENESLATEITLSDSVKQKLNPFFLKNFTPPINIDSISLLDDWIIIKEAFEKVLVVDNLPTFKESDSVNPKTFHPKIKSSGNEITDYIGDMIAFLEGTGESLCRNYDIDSIRKICFRVEQHRYWAIPSNIEKAQRKKDLEDYTDALYEAFH